MPELEFEYGGEVHRVRLEARGDDLTVTLGDRVHEVRAHSHDGVCWQLVIGKRSVIAHVATDGDDRIVAVRGRTFRLFSAARGAARASGGAVASDGRITSPMPGKVVVVRAEPGASVEEGEILAVVEAMKMEHELRAPFAGKVTGVHAEAGAAVGFGDLIVEMEVPGD